MFKESSKTTSPELFSNIAQHLPESKLKRYNDSQAWHNVFRRNITEQIDETIFSPLYPSDTGRSSAPIRVLTAMLILKEGHGWSDAQLIENCNFNILVMNSLGLSNLSDTVPVRSTYYLFKQHLYEHQVKEGIDLMTEMSKTLTKTQAEMYGVNGERIRMDSKLMGSNIAKCSRLQLIINCIQRFYSDLSRADIALLSSSERDLLEKMTGKKSSQIVYGLTNEQKQEYLEKLGYLLYTLLHIYNDNHSEKYRIIQQIFSEQYNVMEEKILLKSVKEIRSDSLQSPDDEDATYRKKDDQQVRGYSVNLTETCDEEGLNLITDVSVEKSNTADNEFLIPSTEASKEILSEDSVKEIYSDGAYHSDDNDEYAQENGITLHHTGMQGATGKYAFEWKENEQLGVTDTQTGECYEAQKQITKKGETRYKVKLSSGYTRYFTVKEIDVYFKRKEIKEMPKELSNRRCNVEASIFQLCFLSRNNKTRYRGIIKHKLWAIGRCLWINMVRIKNYLIELWEKTAQSVKYILNNSQKTTFSAFFSFILVYLAMNIWSFQFKKQTINGFYKIW